MHRDYYSNQSDVQFHADPANAGWPCRQMAEEGTDSYLGTLCEVHSDQASELFSGAWYFDCTNPFCLAECCVCTE